jgi:hypothetical protein
MFNFLQLNKPNKKNEKMKKYKVIRNQAISTEIEGSETTGEVKSS